MPLHLFFFYATLILLPTQLGFHFWPDWALVLGRRLDYLSPTIFLTDITIFLTLIFWLFEKRKRFCVPIGYWFYLKLALLVLFVTANIILASSNLIALYKWFKVFEFTLFGFYIIKTKPSFSRSIWCLSFAVLYSSLIAIAQFFLQHSVGGLLWFLGERTFDVTTPGIARIQLQSIPNLTSYFVLRTSSEVLRPYATFPHPNVLGGFLAVALPLFFSQYNYLKTVRSSRAVEKIFFFLISILGLTALLLTFSRSAWIAFLIMVIILRMKKMFFMSGFSSVILVVLFFVFIGFSFPYFQSLTPGNESVFVRNELTKSAWSVWKTSPFVGVGLGNYLIKLPAYYPHRDIFFLQPVHNIYLLLLSEMGLIGLVFCLWFIVRVLGNKQVRIMKWALCGMLLLGFVDHYPLTLQQGQLLLVVLISFSYGSRSPHWS